MRFFDYLVEVLADGDQPDPDQVADAGYILRSTAFYANGKYGVRSFEGFPRGHPLGVPYRAQFVCAWMFRELAYDLVEHCARAQGRTAAVPFDDRWRRFFGLGNATGLGLVPFAFKHPRVIHAWVAVRELALADVRSLPGTNERVARFEAWIERAHAHFVHGTEDDCSPFLNAVDVASAVVLWQSLQRGVAVAGIDAGARGNTTVRSVELHEIDDGASRTSRARVAHTHDHAHRSGVEVDRGWFERLEAAAAGFLVAESTLDRAD